MRILAGRSHGEVHEAHLRGLVKGLLVAAGEVAGAAGEAEPEPPLVAAGDGEAARQRLTGIYGWLTAGFDIADLQGAKALLEALS